MNTKGLFNKGTMIVLLLFKVYIGLSGSKGLARLPQLNVASVYSSFKK